MAQYSEGSIVIECSLDTKELLENSNKAKSELVRLGNSGSNAAKGLDKIDKSAKSTGDSLDKLTKVAKAVSAALLSSKIIGYAESWNELEDRIANTGATASQTKDILDKLLETSNRNGRVIGESAELYIKLSNSMKELGFNTNDTLSYIDTLSNLMTINKTSVQGAESAINALTKAQMKGKLSSEEANSVFNAMPSILKTLANQMSATGKKVTELDVEKMARDGKLSMQAFTKAMIAAQSETAALADNMRNTVTDGLNRVTNNLTKYLGELNNTTGATQKLVDALVLMSEHVNVLVGAMGVLAAVYAGKYITSMMASVKVKIEDIAASHSQAKAANVVAKAKLDEANANMVLITREKEALLASRQWAIEQLKSATSAQARTVAMNEMAIVQKQLHALEKQELASKAALTVATNNYTASQAKLSLAMKATSTAGNVLRNSLNLLGGPAGIILIAAGAFMTWSSNIEEAKQKALTFGDKIDDLIAKFKDLNQEQRNLELSNLKVEIDNLNKELGWQAFKVEEARKEYEKYQKKVNSFFTGWTTSQEELNKKENEYNNALSEQRKIEGNLAKAQETKATLLNQSAEATDKATESTKELNSAFSKDTTDNITKKLAKLNQELEIARLKQDGLNKESYIYQNVLATLGDKADIYKDSINALLRGKGDLSQLSTEEAKSIQDLISKYGELWAVTNQGKAPIDSTKQAINDLSVELNIAKYEAQGLIDKANELRAIQALGLDPNNAKEIASNNTKIEQMQKLIEQQNQLNLAKQGLDVAKQEIDSRLSPTEQIEQELKDKQTLIDAAYEQGLLSEQIYNDSILAAKQNAADKQKKIDDDLLAEKLANNQSLLSASSDLFGGLADLTKTFSNKQSAAYKAMFAVSKGFAIANATLSVASAAVKVLDDPTAVTPAQKFANYAAVAAAGGSLVSQLSSLSYGGGREHGGQVNANSMYRVGEGNKPEILQSGGRQYMIPGEAGKVVSNKDINSNSTQSAPIINWSINVIGGDANNTSVNIDKDKNEINIMLNAVAGDIRDKGKIYNALKETTNVKSRL